MYSDMKVLVVDNSAPMRRAIRGVFSQIGFKNIIWAGEAVKPSKNWEKKRQA